MVDWIEVRHQVAIAGEVLDALTNRPISSAQVSISAGPDTFVDSLALIKKQYGDQWEIMIERPDRTLTADDGHFHFMDLPDGSYTLIASLPGDGSRYGIVEANPEVSRGANEKINMGTINFLLPPTTIKGEVSDLDTGDPVILAEVRVIGSGESVYTGTDGRYLLNGLEIGVRKVQVSAQGYQKISQEVEISESGSTSTLDVLLSPVTP